MSYCMNAFYFRITKEMLWCICIGKTGITLSALLPSKKNCLLITSAMTLEARIQRFPGIKVVKNLPANAGDTRDPGSSFPGSGRSTGEGNGKPLQNSCLRSHGQRSLTGCKESKGLQRVRCDLAHTYPPHPTPTIFEKVILIPSFVLVISYSSS